MQLRVLSVDLTRGHRPSGGPDELADALVRAEWDVAVLGGAAPAWPAQLARALGCEFRAARSGGRALPGVPGGGHVDAVLARADRIITHRTQRVRRLPRRVDVQGVRLACGIWLATAAAGADAGDAAGVALRWAAGGPVVLAGPIDATGAAGFTAAARHGGTCILVAGGARPAADVEIAGAPLDGAVSVTVHLPSP